MRCFIGLFFALFATAIRADAPQTPSFHIVGNILYQTAEPSERADAYLPISASANSPAVIWMHGNHHDKTDSREKNICSQLAAAGYVAISINYGTWPDSDGGEEHSPRILQNIANARNAIRFFRAHATDYGIDPQRIALFGGSAGGWLSLMVGLTNGDASFDSTPPYSGVSSAVSAIGDFYADTDPWLKSKITPNSPPVLIIQGNADPAVDYHESIELDHLLANAGVPHQLLLLEGVGHGFDFTTWQKKPLPQDLLPVVLAFLKEHLALAAVAAVDTNDDPLTHLRKGHPRLLFTDEDLAKALAAAKTDPLRADLHKHIIATAEAILHAPPIRQPDRAQGQEQDRYAVYNILTCAMAYRLTGDERFFSRAKNDLLTAAVFPDWAPKHFLSVGEMSFASAIGYDWFYAKLTPDERTIIKKGLLQNSLSFADEVYGNAKTKNADWSGKGTGNWNQVCNSGLLSAALAIADEEPELARKVILGARNSIPNGMKAYAPDGGFPEGPGYWTYATTYAAIAFTELHTALGIDFNLPSSPGFDKTIYYYEAAQGPTNLVFDYADCNEDLQISPARTWLAKRFDSPFALHHTRALLADFLQQNPIAKFDRVIEGTVVNRFFALHAVWFPDEPTQPIINPPLDFHFRGAADIATFRSEWNNPNAIFVGLKAGDTADHHTHLDLGSFILDADGQRWAMDLGRENYDLPGYGDTKKGQRWTYFRLNNHGHNTVTPGDAIQSHNIVSPIIQYAAASNRAFAITDLTPAYPNDATSLHRGIALLDRARVLVQDEYQPTKTNEPLHWVMITPTKIELSNDGHSAILTSNGKTLRADLLEPTTAKFHIASTRPPTPAESQNDGTEMLAIDLIPNTDGSSTRLAVLLTPVGKNWPKLNPPALIPLNEWK